MASINVRNDSNVLVCQSSPTRADRYESQGPQELVDCSLAENSSLLRKTHQELSSIYGLAGEEDLLGPAPCPPFQTVLWDRADLHLCLETGAGFRTKEGMIFSGVCPWNWAQLGLRGRLSLSFLKDKEGTLVSWTVAFSCG